MYKSSGYIEFNNVQLDTDQVGYEVHTLLIEKLQDEINDLNDFIVDMQKLENVLLLNEDIEKKGEGMHHICYLVDDIKIGISHLKNLGIEMIDNEPRVGLNNTLVAFAHPKSMNSVLIELAQKIT